jgi:energy-coupling factor transporter ATP-binding protein EcfA2
MTRAPVQRPSRAPAVAQPAVIAQGLRTTYGPLVAVDDVSFEVAAGEIYGILGPHGAGKTAVVECLQGLRRPNSGELSVLGLDPRCQQRDRHGRRQPRGVASTAPTSGPPAAWTPCRSCGRSTGAVVVLDRCAHLLPTPMQRWRTQTQRPTFSAGPLWREALRREAGNCVPPGRPVVRFRRTPRRVVAGRRVRVRPGPTAGQGG